MKRFSAASLAGVAAGLAYFAHAMIQNSHAWPLLWAFLAGALAVILAGRSTTGSFGPALGLGALTGLIAGVIFLITTTIALFGLGVPEEASQELQNREGAAFLGLVIAAALGVVAATIGSALAHFAFTRRS